MNLKLSIFMYKKWATAHLVLTFRQTRLQGATPSRRCSGSLDPEGYLSFEAVTVGENVRHKIVLLVVWGMGFAD